MIRRSTRTSVLIVAASALVTVGCAGTVDRAEDAAATATPPELIEPHPEGEVIESESEPIPTGPPTNQRGNIEAQPGEEGTISDTATGLPVITYAIDAVGPADCRAEYAEYGYAPVNGNLIAVDMRVSTAPELASSSVGSYFTVGTYDFSFVGPDGITVTDLGTSGTYGCLDETESFTSSQLRPGSNYVGKVVLDVPAETGSLIYRPSASPTGWEIAF